MAAWGGGPGPAQRALPAAPRAPHLPRASHASAPSRKRRPAPFPPLVARHFRPVKAPPHLAACPWPEPRAGGGAAHARGRGWGAGREA